MTGFTENWEEASWEGLVQAYDRDGCGVKPYGFLGQQWKERSPSTQRAYFVQVG